MSYFIFLLFSFNSFHLILWLLDMNTRNRIIMIDINLFSIYIYIYVKTSIILWKVDG